MGCSASYAGYFDGGFLVLSGSGYVHVGEVALGAFVWYLDGVVLHGCTVVFMVFKGFREA